MSNGSSPSQPIARAAAKSPPRIAQNLLYQAKDRSASVLEKQWELLKRIGSGGMADVYWVESKLVRWKYALKILGERYVHNPDAITRLEHEFCVLKRISNSHIVKAESFFYPADEPCFFIMEMVEGPTLNQLLASGPLPIDRALRISNQLLDTIETLHEKGLIHRDIKPLNIIIDTRDGLDHAVLIDFGICKWTAKFYANLDRRTSAKHRLHTEEGIVLGTPGYMGVPRKRIEAEAEANDEQEKLRDVFGLGVTIFQLMVGRMPYGNREPRPGEEVEWTVRDERMPAAFQGVLETAVASDPADRWRSIAEFREEFHEAVKEFAAEHDEAEGGTRSRHLESRRDTAKAGKKTKERSRHRLVKWSLATLVLGSLVTWVLLWSIPSTGLSAHYAALARVIRSTLAVSTGVNTCMDSGACVRPAALHAMAGATDTDDRVDAGIKFGAGLGGANVSIRARDAGRGAGVRSGLGVHARDAGAEVRDPGIDADIKAALGDRASSCIPATASADAYVELRINAEGRVSEVTPGPGVSTLTVLCLAKKLDGFGFAIAGGQSTQRVPLMHFKRLGGEHNNP